MISTDTVRKLVAVADVAKDPYAVAAGAASLLAMGGPAAEGMAESYVRALAVLRLHAPAMRLLKAKPTAGAPGPIAWNSRARRFAANLRALEKKTPSAALVAEAASRLSPFELYQAADGNYQILDTSQPAYAGWLGGLVDHKGAVNWNVGTGTTRIVQPIAFDSVGMGWPLMQFLDATANSFLNYSCAVYVLACDPLALAMLLHMHDWQDLINGPRVRWFIAATAEAAARDFTQALCTHTTWSLPAQSVRCVLRNSPPIDIDNAVIAQRNEREAHIGELQASIAGHYAGRDAAWWRQRFNEAQSGGPPLRVLGLTSRFTTVLQYSMQELHAAVQAAGATMEVAIEPDDQSLENPFLEQIATHQPDLIIQLSRMRYENPRLPREIPFLAWDQDNLPCMRTPEAKASLDALTFVAGHGAIFGYVHLGWPLHNCIFCHPAGASHRYHNAPAPAALLEKHACDISYVSNASATPESLHAELHERWKTNPHIAATFDSLCRQVHDGSIAGTVWDDIALRPLLEQTARANALPLSDPLAHELLMDIHRYADRCFRHATLAWVSRWCAAHGKTLRLYGRGWESHPEFARWAAGTAEPGEPLRAIYQASRINLQLIESGFAHSRALDGMAAGGFFLARQVCAEGENPELFRDLHSLATWAARHNIAAPEQLTQAADAHVRDLWQRALARHRWTPARAVRELRVWAQILHELAAYPMLPRISFRDEMSFGKLAADYLANDALRQSIAAEMRQITLDQFSYDSRWKQFLSGIQTTLAAPAKS